MDPAAGDLDSRVVRYRLHGLNSGIGGQAENGMCVSQITSICSYELIPPLFRERCVSSQPERRRWPEIVAESTTLRGEQLRLAWAELLGCLAWERMVTLTFKEPGNQKTGAKRGDEVVRPHRLFPANSGRLARGSRVGSRWSMARACIAGGRGGATFAECSRVLGTAKRAGLC